MPSNYVRLCKDMAFKWQNLLKWKSYKPQTTDINSPDRPQYIEWIGWEIWKKKRSKHFPFKFSQPFLLTTVKVSVISWAEGRGWKYLPRPRLFRISQNPNPVITIVLLYTALNKIRTNTAPLATQFDITLRKMECTHNLQFSKLSATNL